MRCQATMVRQVLLGVSLDLTCLALLAGEPREATRAVFEREREGPVEASRQFGNNCHLPGSYQGALQAFLHHRHSPDLHQQYRDTIREI